MIDMGAGSGRFLVEAGRRMPGAALVGIELDPVAALLCRGHLASAGLSERATVLLADYRRADVEKVRGRTLYIGNPPYVRHHLIEPQWKAWLVRHAAERGIPASQLAGLHAYFFLATALYASPGDIGSVITSAEWLDVNYGSLIRHLLLRDLGLRRLEVVEPSAAPFPDAMTTAVITQFVVGATPRAVQMVRVPSLPPREAPPLRRVHRERLKTESRWSHLTRPRRTQPAGFVELGELCRVHRGQVTGANKAWIEGPHSHGLPEEVLFRTVTRARELLEAGAELTDAERLRRVIDLPEDLGVFGGAELRAVERFLDRLRRMRVHEGYIASHRRAWWSVGLRTPAPILATYMARRPPVFVRNRVAARHINIAHGLYPREAFAEPVLAGLCAYLNGFTQQSDGRTYAGGLTKFEPREMERLMIPSPERLLERSDEVSTPLEPRGAGSRAAKGDRPVPGRAA
ncbi:MAG TPA: class I SAM-dependent methyltransferase [Longimicrobium sp.]|nr:class I SAM-dependent methyltransferase [Longimicrobium sp.]